MSPRLPRKRLGQPEAPACAAIRIVSTHEEPDPNWDNAITFRAMSGATQVGYLDTYRYPDKSWLKSGLVEVDPNARRCKLGTRLYMAAADYACREGLEMVSDTYRTEFSEGFWDKQRKRGRAACLPGEGHRLDPGGDMDKVVGTWPCERYKLKRCEVDLSGHRSPHRRRRK